jgi:hypothetical protein
MKRSQHFKGSHCFHLEAQAVQEELLLLLLCYRRKNIRILKYDYVDLLYTDKITVRFKTSREAEDLLFLGYNGVSKWPQSSKCKQSMKTALTLKVEEACFLEMSISTWHHIPEALHLQQHHCENLIIFHLVGFYETYIHIPNTHTHSQMTYNK